MSVNHKRRRSDPKLFVHPIPQLRLKVTDGLTAATMDAVYTKVIGPILNKYPPIDDLPSPDKIVDVAYMLSSRGRRDPETNMMLPPVILVKFCSKEIRDQIMRNRRMLRSVAVDRREEEMGVQNYWVSEDLTREIQAKLQATLKTKTF